MLEILLYMFLVIISLIALIFVVIPATVYMIVKVGTFAFYRGKQQFEDDEDKNKRKFT